MAKYIKGLLILALIAGIIGIVPSAAMVIRAVQWQEWGRVLLYSVTAIISLEILILTVCKLRDQEKT